jgi:hypothetical protein
MAEVAETSIRQACEHIQPEPCAALIDARAESETRRYLMMTPRYSALVDEAYTQSHRACEMPAQSDLTALGIAIISQQLGLDSHTEPQVSLLTALVRESVLVPCLLDLHLSC